MVPMLSTRLTTWPRPATRAEARENRDKLSLEQVESEVLDLPVLLRERDQAKKRRPVLWILLEQRVLEQRVLEQRVLVQRVLVQRVLVQRMQGLVEALPGQLEQERLLLYTRGRREMAKQKLSVEQVESEVLDLTIFLRERDQAEQRGPVLWILLEQRVLEQKVLF